MFLTCFNGKKAANQTSRFGLRLLKISFDDVAIYEISHRHVF